MVPDFRGVAIQRVMRRITLGRAHQFLHGKCLELRAARHRDHAVVAHALVAQEMKHQRIAGHGGLEVREVIRHPGLTVHEGSFLSRHVAFVRGILRQGDHASVPRRNDVSRELTIFMKLSRSTGPHGPNCDLS
jgi:hypothetical protein